MQPLTQTSGPTLHHYLNQPPSATMCKLAPPTTTSTSERIQATCLVEMLRQKKGTKSFAGDALPPNLSAVRAKNTLVKSKTRAATATCPATTLLQKKKRAVRFATSNETRLLEQERTMMTDEDKHQLWYQPQEFSEMDQDCLENLHAFHQVNGDLVKLNRDEYCLRGLEIKTSPHINRLRQLRATITVRAVLDTQTHQRRMRMIDDESLASVSRCYTQTARTRAQELGLIDSIESIAFCR